MVQHYSEHEVELKTGKKIWMYDDVFSFQQMKSFYQQAKNSFYRLRSSDNEVLEYKEHVNISSQYTDDDVKMMGIYDIIPEEIKTKHHIAYENMDDTMINLISPDSRFHTHVDNDSIHGRTLLYYMNLEWDVEWGGDTLFLDESGKTIEFYAQFKPGRLVIFDPKIPHLIRPSTQLAPHYRFSLATKFIPRALEPSF